MFCTHCGTWELAEGDLFCCWCGASYLRFTVDLQPAMLSTEEYPPPVALSVRNESPMGAITLARIQSSQIWASLLPNQPLPQLLGPGAQHIFLLDVDTFASRDGGEITIAVSALYACETRNALLHVRPPEAVAAETSKPQK